MHFKLHLVRIAGPGRTCSLDSRTCAQDWEKSRVKSGASQFKTSRLSKVILPFPHRNLACSAPGLDFSRGEELYGPACVIECHIRLTYMELG